MTRKNSASTEQAARDEQAHTLSKEEWHELVQATVDEALVEEARTGSMPSLAVIFMDANYFKEVNDTLGHEVGDQIIDELKFLIGDAIRSVEKETEEGRPPDFMSVSPSQKEERYFPGHIGGDEYAILALTDDAGAKVVVDRLRSVINGYLGNPENAALRELDVNMAMGVAVLQPRMTATDLLTAADQEMYEDKLRQLQDLDEEGWRMLERMFEDLAEHKIRFRDLGKYALLLARRKANLAE